MTSCCATILSSGRRSTVARTPSPPGSKWLRPLSEKIPSATALEGARFTALVALPNVVQGLFQRRPRAVAAATRMDVDRRAVQTVGGLRRRYGDAVWIRVAGSKSLLLLSTDAVRRVLAGSPEPFAADPEAKRRGMSHFQPDALTLSRGDAWRNRRRFTEAVLDTGKPMHRLADRFVEVVHEEAGKLLAHPELDWDAFHKAVQRITRRVILGEAARDDVEVSQLLETLMAEANKPPKGDERSDSFQPFMARLESYVDGAEANSLVGLFASAPHDDSTRVAGQIPHWMFALGDTLAANALRALALIVSHPTQRTRVEKEIAATEHVRDDLAAVGVAGLDYLEACIEEAMRLWPTTALLSREAVRDADLNGAPVPAGTQLLISNVFNHRDPQAHAFADRFSPEAWTDGDAASDWSFNQFSHGPQGCPGAGLALFVGKALIAELLAGGEVQLAGPELDPGRPLPHMLDFFTLRFALQRKL